VYQKSVRIGSVKPLMARLSFGHCKEKCPLR